MSAKGKKSKLGHDPLAWISEEDAAEIQQANSHLQEELNEHEEIDSVDQTDTSHEVLDDKAVNKESNTHLIDADSKESLMLDLPLYFGIAQVAEVYEQMKEMVESNAATVEIQAEDIESIDASAIQLLIVFVIALKAKGKKVVWKGVSKKLSDAALMFQVNDHIDMVA